MSQERSYQFLKGGLVAALLALVGYIDLVTGYELSAFPLYALPIALAVAYMIGNLRRARSQLQNFSGTLTVCTACSRVRDRDGYWWEVQSYLRAYGGALTQAKLCPDCAHEAYVPDQHAGAAAHR